METRRHRMKAHSWWTKRVMSASVVLLSLAAIANVKGVNVDFTIYEMNMEREDAKQFCLSHGYAGLAVLDSQERMDAVFALSNFNFFRNYWVGLKQGQLNLTDLDATPYHWDSPNAKPWIKWYEHDPNKHLTQQCARIFKNTGRIANKECNEENYFVCEQSYEEDLTTEMVPTTESSTESSTLSIQLDRRYGCYPIIHRDKSFQNTHQGLKRYSGTTRSEIDCAIICTQDSQCGYLVFTGGTRMCTTYSSSLKTIPHSTQVQIGTDIREKRE